MPRPDQPKSSTLRSRQRITNKTRLRVVHGNIDAETVTIGEDDGRGVLHSTQGVEAEDAAEHHLQQVLNAANNSANNHQRHQRPSTADASSQQTLAAPAPAPEANFIPTPDAQGVVANYDELYQPSKFEMPYAILKFSDTVEECHTYGLAGRSYVMDERDAAWLEQWNQLARGEGTSSGSTRRSKLKASENEDEPLLVIEEDWFEFCMGLFEKFSLEHYPFLHLDNSIPPFPSFEPLLSQPYTPALFATSLVPDGLPDPSDLIRMAKAIHPHWAERKQERRGRTIMPDVNLDESDEGNVYVCFRRREVKPIRKTRRMETTSIDKMTRLSNEFQSALQLANTAIEREEVKRNMFAEEHGIWSLRSRMISITSKFPDLRNPEDDKWLVDKEKVKKPRPIDQLPPLRIPRPAQPTPVYGDEPVDLGPPVVHPRARYDDIQYKIEQDVQKKREQDVLGWVDATNTPVQNLNQSSERYFRELNGSENTSPSDRGKRAPQAASVRHRVGRGGRRYLDRRMSPFTSTPLANRAPPNLSTYIFNPPALFPAFALRVPPWVGFPHSPSTPPSSQDDADVDTEELAKRLQDRWKFDPDVVPIGKEHGGRPIIDDFDYRQSLQRYALVKDREWLFAPETSRAVSDPKINLTAPLQDALNVQGEHRLHQAQQAAVNGTPVATVQSTQTSPLSQQQSQQQQQPAQVRVSVPNGTPIRPPVAPQGMSPQTPSRPPQPAQQQQVAALLLQQQHLRDKQNQQAAAAAASTPTATPTTNGVSQPSPSPNPTQPQSQPQASPSPSVSQPMTNGNTTATPVAASPAPPVATFVPLQINGTNGITPSPPKVTPNGTYQQSPSASPLPHSAGMVGTDAGSIVRVSTPIRKPTMQMPNGTPMQLNGFQPLPNPVAMQPNQHPAFNNGVAGIPAGMYNNLQSMKMINQQQMLAQYQQQFQGHLTPHQVQQQQHFQQQQQQMQQQQQLQQQLHMMQMQHAGGMGNPMQGHYGDPMGQQQHMPMNMQPNQAIYGQNMFPMGMAPGMNNNSALNMTMQNMNLQLGPQNMALRLPPNRMQQQANIVRPVTSMGGDFSMGMGNGSPMMQGMPNMVMGGATNQQMQMAMGIPRAPSTPLSLRGGGGLMPNGNMMMGRSPSAAMQSPMMRPTSAASMHSNMGMQMQATPSLPVSLQGSPASMQQPVTPHMRQQTVPGL
ncbi:hypothetical protein M408DRAFT_14308 [Serendipita vermifera MAFF 305830]|uniref:Enhancer of polycomb-like N-terminal domain-containing protein n=1 Tax=Serendipita vermifera MAFF 305830 TaxID=933852 RepID=A0A0C3BA37_SERVB|nr:hypothetical protein M408DRAFT_14308 [Serendipita vermifera MAFF 305830]